MAILAILTALFFHASPVRADEPADSEPTPAATTLPVEQESADVDPTSPIKAWTLIGAYTGATYGPGNLPITQIVAREEVLRLGSSLVRATLPPVVTVRGVTGGLGDAVVFYLATRRSAARGFGVGLSATFPTASDPRLGTGKWNAGPSVAFAAINRSSRILAGFLMQSFFSYAGPSWRRDQSLVTFQPAIVKQLGSGWSIRSADATWAFDLERGSSIVPISLGVGKLFKIGQQSLNVVLVDVGTVVHANAPNAPKNTVKLLFRVMYPRHYPPL
jgi:hypothetical protein